MGNRNLQEVKQWLKRYGDAERRSAALDTRIESLRAKAMSPRGPRLDGMPHKPGFEGDDVGAVLAKISEVEKEARDARAHARGLYCQIDSVIRRIDGPGCAEKQTVLQVRYLDLDRWQGVAEVVFGDRDNYDERQESFLRRTYKIHNAALIELSKYVPLDKGQENESEMEDKKWGGGGD